MPKDTFFRLPPEKRQRIIDSAKQEFSRVPLNEASINKIIKGAEISRGSFYQYFEDKNDLFLYILSLKRDKVVDVIRSDLKKLDGNVFLFLYSYTDKFLEFYHSGIKDELIMFLSNGDPVKYFFKEIKTNPDKLNDMQKETESQVFENLNFEILNIKPEEKLQFIGVIDAVLKDSLHAIIFREKEGSIEEICENFRRRIQFLEKYFMKESCLREN